MASENLSSPYQSSPCQSRVMLNVFSEHHNKFLWVDLADVRVDNFDENDPIQPVPEWMTLPTSLSERGRTVYMSSEGKEPFPVALSHDDITSLIKASSPNFTALEWGGSDVLYDLELAMQLDHQDSAQRTVLAQAMGAELTLVGRLGLKTDGESIYGRAAQELLEKESLPVQELLLALSAGLNPVKKYGVDVTEVPYLQWEHPDTGEAVSHSLSCLFRCPLMMLSILARSLPR